MRKGLILVIATACIALAMAIPTIGQNKGAEHITLDAGSKGTVEFPHRLHQNALGDSNLCHNLFPQVRGIIKKMKDEGKFKKGKIMNQCLTCHKAKIKQVVKSGPTKCWVCHKK